MNFRRTRCTILFLLLLVTWSVTSLAQPTLPDLIGDEENGVVMLSWTCQYDGVKSIAVLRSADSNFNYYTIGFVKKLFKGVQAYADGHPMPGKNYYKLSIVFNSGLTWGSNHTGVYVDSVAIRKSRLLPPNEQLQKLIVTEGEKPASRPEKQKQGNKPNYVNSAVAPADRDKYMEVLKKEPVTEARDTVAVAEPPKPRYKVKNDDEADVDVANYMEMLPEEVKKKITVTYANDTSEIDAGQYMETAKPVEQKKIVNVTFEDKEDAAAFVATLPRSEQKKFTVTYNVDTAEPDASRYIDTKKEPQKGRKVSVTMKNGEAMQALVNNIKSAQSKVTISYSIDTADLHNKMIKEEVAKEAPVPPKPRISIKFSDEMNVNEAADVKSRFIFNDAASGHVTMNLPDDVITHHYSVKFYDREGHMVIEIPHINTAHIILDKRNFQKKGQYRFVLRRDVVELESGYINIY